MSFVVPDLLSVAKEAGNSPQSEIFNRLLQDRIVVLGTEVEDTVANTIIGQMLYLEGQDDSKDISHRVTTKVPCAEYFELRDRALLAHATQVDPTGRWFALPLEVQRETWPTEDYELARSLVEPLEPGTIEDDLFAGVAAKVEA